MSLVKIYLHATSIWGELRKMTKYLLLFAYGLFCYYLGATWKIHGAKDVVISLTKIQDTEKYVEIVVRGVIIRICLTEYD